MKSKCLRAEPFVVGGFTASCGGVSAQRIGQYDAAGALRYAESVGTGKGFTREFLRALHEQFAGISAARSPFVDFHQTALRLLWGNRLANPTQWVQPLVVVDIAFLERTGSGQLRHPSYQRLRPDLIARQVIRI